MEAARSVLARLASCIGDDELTTPDITLAVLTYDQGNCSGRAGHHSSKERDDARQDDEGSHADSVQDDTIVQALLGLPMNVFDSRVITAMPLFMSWQEMTAASGDDDAESTVDAHSSRRRASGKVEQDKPSVAMGVDDAVHAGEDVAHKALRARCRDHIRELSVLYHILLRPREAYQWQLNYDRLMDVLASKNFTGALMEQMEHVWKWQRHADPCAGRSGVSGGGQDDCSARVSWETFLSLYVDILALYVMHAEELEQERMRKEQHDQEEEEQQQQQQQQEYTRDATAHETCIENSRFIMDESQLQRCLTLSWEMDRQRHGHAETGDGALGSPVPTTTLSRAGDHREWEGSYHIPRSVILLTCVVARQAHAMSPQTLQPVVQMMQQEVATEGCAGNTDTQAPDSSRPRRASLRALDGMVGVVAMAALPHVVEQLRQRRAALTGKDTHNGHDEDAKAAAVAATAAEGEEETRRVRWAHDLLLVACHGTAYDRDVAVHFRQDGLHSPLRSFASATLARVFARFLCLLHVRGAQDAVAAAPPHRADEGDIGANDFTHDAVSRRSDEASVRRCSDAWSMGAVPRSHRDENEDDYEEEDACNEVSKVQHPTRAARMPCDVCETSTRSTESSAPRSPREAAETAVWQQFTPHALFHLARSMRLYAYAWRESETVRVEMTAVVRSLLHYVYNALCHTSDARLQVTSSSSWAPPPSRSTTIMTSVYEAPVRQDNDTSSLMHTSADTSAPTASSLPAQCSAALPGFVSVEAQRRYLVAIYAYASAALPYLCPSFETCASVWIWSGEVRSYVHETQTPIQTPPLPRGMTWQTIIRQEGGGGGSAAVSFVSTMMALLQQQQQRPSSGVMNAHSRTCVHATLSHWLGRAPPAREWAVSALDCPILHEAALALAHSLLTGFAADVHHVSRRVGSDVVTAALAACRADLAHTDALSPYAEEMTLALAERYEADLAAIAPGAGRVGLQQSLQRSIAQAALSRVWVEMYLCVHLCYRDSLRRIGRRGERIGRWAMRREEEWDCVLRHDAAAEAAARTARQLWRVLGRVPAQRWKQLLTGPPPPRRAERRADGKGGEAVEGGQTDCRVPLGRCSDGGMIYLHVLHYIHTLMQLCPRPSWRALFVSLDASDQEEHDADDDDHRRGETTMDEGGLCRRVWDGTLALMQMYTDHTAYCPMPHISLHRMLRVSLQLLRHLLRRSRHHRCYTAAATAAGGRQRTYHRWTWKATTMKRWMTMRTARSSMCDMQPPRVLRLCRTTSPRFGGPCLPSCSTPSTCLVRLPVTRTRRRRRMHTAHSWRRYCVRRCGGCAPLRIRTHQHACSHSRPALCVRVCSLDSQTTSTLSLKRCD